MSAPDSANAQALTGGLRADHDFPLLRRAARATLRRILARHGGNCSSAAREIGVGKSTLFRWFHDHPDLRPKEQESTELP